MHTWKRVELLQSLPTVQHVKTACCGCAARLLSQAGQSPTPTLFESIGGCQQRHKVGTCSSACVLSRVPSALPAQVGYYANLTALVEAAVAANGGTKALLLAHSMGNLVSLAFLRMHTPAWRAQHIAALVGLSGPWGGSVTALKGAPVLVLGRSMRGCGFLSRTGQRGLPCCIVHRFVRAERRQDIAALVWLRTWDDVATALKGCAA